MNGLSYTWVITACSLFFVISIFYYFRPYKNVLYIAIPLCIACHIITSSNLIRWYMAISFILFSLRNYEDGNNVKAICLFLCGFLCHYAIIVAGCLFAFAKNIRVIATPKTAVVVCTLLILFFDRSFLIHFGFLFDLFRSINRFTDYFSDGYSYIIGIDGGYAEGKTLFMSFFSFIPFYIIIIWGYKLLNRNVLNSFQYNLIVLASYLKVTSTGLELLGRFYYVLDIPLCLCFSYVTINLFKEKKNMMLIICLFFCVLYIGRKYIYMCAPMEYEQLMLYIWDDNIDPGSMLQFKKQIAD